jgi:hypothetical protein
MEKLNMTLEGTAVLSSSGRVLGAVNRLQYSFDDTTGAINMTVSMQLSAEAFWFMANATREKEEEGGKPVSRAIKL